MSRLPPRIFRSDHTLSPTPLPFPPSNFNRWFVNFSYNRKNNPTRHRTSGNDLVSNWEKLGEKKPSIVSVFKDFCTTLPTTRESLEFRFKIVVRVFIKLEK